MNRRQFLEAALAGATIVLGGDRRAARAAAPSSVPTVGRLVMTNAVDNIYDIFAHQGTLGSIAVARTPARGGGPPLIAEHGLAYHLASIRKDDRREILLDFALTDRALLNNYAALGIDPARADALILSHGHNDHYGGLVGLVGPRRDSLKHGLALYTGGEDTFCHRIALKPNGERIDYGQLDRAELENLGLQVVIAVEPAVVAGHALTTGRIARTTDFEKPPTGARLVLGAPGTACSASVQFPGDGTTEEAKPGELVPDTFPGEHATAYHVRDRGLVVITSCGHAGVINSIRQAQKLTGVEKIHAIAGGFHLAPAPDEIVAKTVEALESIDPDYIVPAHCAGLNTIMAVHRKMPEKLVMPSTGTRVTFGA